MKFARAWGLAAHVTVAASCAEAKAIVASVNAPANEAVVQEMRSF